MAAAWRESFAAFIADVGPRPSKEHSIERLNNDGDYEPGNCKWATRSEQASNTKRVKLFEWRGAVRTLTEICRLENVRYNNVRNRIFMGGLTLGDAIIDVRNAGLGYVERAACRGGTGKPITGIRRNRKKASAVNLEPPDE